MRLAGAAACVALLIVPMGAVAEERAPSSETQADAVLALARLYGAVRYFHPGDANPRVPWDRFLIRAADRALTVTAREEIGPMLRETFAIFTPGVEIAEREFAAPIDGDSPSKATVEWRHFGLGIGQKNNPYASWRISRDETPQAVPSEVASEVGAMAAGTTEKPWSSFPLGAGWHARVRISLSSGDALVTLSQDDSILRLDDLPQWDLKAATMDRPRAVAVGIAVWSIAKNFYPYWADVKVDWDRAFREWLRSLPETQSRKELQRNLRRLVALLDDGHAGIGDSQAHEARRFLPIAIRPLGNAYLVVASTVADVVAGDIIESVDGRPIAEVAREMMAVTPMGAHARMWWARRELLSGDAGSSVRLGIRRNSSTRDVEVRYQETRTPLEERPDMVSELRPGIRYVDLTRVTRAAFEAALPGLSSARAIIFDLRGYPTGDARSVVPYWMTRDDDVKWMQVPMFTRPYEEAAKFAGFDWALTPKAGLENVKKILLIDPRAVSYAESVVGYFDAHARGTLIGEPTAGANGNVSLVDLPGGFTFRFTGMLVTTHDGRRFHARGFQPNIVVIPTAEGVRAGRDEVLERALEVARGN